MPSNIYNPLPTNSPRAFIQPSAETESGTELAQAAGQIAKDVVDLKKMSILGALAQEAQNTVSQTSQYQQAKDSIVAQMSTADRETFNQLSAQLERLRKGEVQGVISPQAANIRLQTTAKTFINRYPRMASEIRQMLKLVSGDIAPDTKTGDIADPILKAQYEIVEEARARGTSPQDVILLRRQKDATEMSKAKLEQAEAEGNYRTPELMFELVDNKSSEVFSELISGMMSRIKAGSFVKENELAGLRSAQAQALVDLNKELTDYQLKTGVRVDHSRFEARIKSSFEPLIALAGEADSVEKQKRLVQAQDTILKATDYRYLHDVVGAFAPIAVNSPEQAFKIMDELSKTIEQITSGQLPSLEQIAKYDPKTKMMLDTLKGREGGKAWELLMARTNELLTGKRPSSTTGSEAVDRLAGKILLDAAAQPGTPSEESGKLLANYILSGDPIDAVLKHKRTHSVLRQSPEAQQALEKQALQQIVSFVQTRPLTEIQNIVIDMSNPKTPFQNTLPETMLSPADEFSMSGGLRTTFAQPANQFVDKMNSYAQLMLLYKDPTEAANEIEGKFVELINSRVSNEMQALQALSEQNPEGEEGEEGEDGKKVTKVDKDGKETSTGSKKRYQYDAKNDVIIDTKRNRVLPDTYTFSPEELKKLQEDLGDITNLGSVADDFTVAVE